MHKTLHDLHIRLIRFDGYSGIIRCAYTEKDAVIKVLGSITMVGKKKVEVTPKATSGTIRSLM